MERNYNNILISGFFNKYCLLLLIILLSKNINCQTVRYTVYKNSRIIDEIDTVNYYWKIDSTKIIKIDTVSYYAFSLGEDTLNMSDYLNIDFLLKKYSYVRGIENKTIYFNSDVQTFFLSKRKKYKINYFGAIGTLNIFKVRPKKELCFVKITYLENISLSDNFFIKELVFLDKPFPLLIYFSNGGDEIHIGNAHVCKATSHTN